VQRQVNPLFSTVTLAQALIMPVSTAAVALESLFIKNMELRSIIVTLTTAIFAQLAVSFRKPSTLGGTVEPAAIVKPTGEVVGTDVIKTMAPEQKKGLVK
jgi:hypothetical protein